MLHLQHVVCDAFAFDVFSRSMPYLILSVFFPKHFLDAELHFEMFNYKKTIVLNMTNERVTRGSNKTTHTLLHTH